MIRAPAAPPAPAGMARGFAVRFVAMLMMVAGGAECRATAPVQVPYDIDHGVIEFEISGAEPGSETLYFADHGLRQARVRTVYLMTEHGPQPTRTMIIDTPQFHYLIDLDAGRGTRKRFSHADASPDRYAADALWQALKAEPRGERKLAGQTCRLWVSETTGSQTCLWKGLRLESSIQADTQLDRVLATRIDLKSVVPDSRFEPPPHTVITDLQGDFLR